VNKSIIFWTALSVVVLIITLITLRMSVRCRKCDARFMKHSSKRFDFGLLGPAGRWHTRKCRKCGYAEKTTEWVASWKSGSSRFDEWEEVEPKQIATLSE
jgi:hypothetical protein